MARLVACVIGACLAVALIEAVIRDAWDIVAMALVPLYFAGRLYGIGLRRLSSERRHRDALQSRDHAITIVDTSGRVTVWNDALARLVGCPRAQAVGRPLAHAMRRLGETELPRALDAALKDLSPRTLPDLRLTPQKGGRILSADILPDAKL